MAATRVQLVDAAKTADKAQDFDEMCKCVRGIAQMGQPLTVEERTMFHIAYKNATAKKRYELRQAAGDAGKAKAVTDICGEVLDLLDKYLIPSCKDAESQIFLLKMKGDYHRYYTEVSPTQAEKDCARAAYDNATRLAKSALKEWNPLRLNVALNYGVFEYETLGSKQRGFEITKAAFDAAHPAMKDLEEAQFKESAFVMELLRENITLWAKELGVDLGAK